MKRIILTSLAVLLTIAGPSPATAQSGTDLFQQALRKEQVDGDLKAAMALYQRILKEHAVDRALSAKTLVQLGQAYEKIGNADARSSYQRVIREYADQTEPAAVARARLAALRPDAVPVASRGPVARRLLSSSDSTDGRIENPRVMVPSPDGRRVAYVQTSTREAGVYVRDLASGAVQQVAAREAAANANNWSSVWSADGKRLAFVQTSGEKPATTVRIFDFTSRETVAIPGLDARGLYLLDWSRDGRYLLCNNLRGTLDLVAVADGRMTTLSDSIWAGNRASFSPDGRFVAFAAGKYGSWTLYVQPVAGGPRQRIAETREGVYLHPMWSPDGRAIAYHHPNGIWVAPMDGGVPSGAPRLAYRISSPRWGVAWTEAGGLYFTVNSQREIPYQVAVDPAAGRAGETGTRVLPHHPDNQRLFAWSPDMQRIAFANWDGDLTIYTADGDRMTSQKVAAPDEAVASLWWSPDGREVQYEHVQTGGPISQWRVTVKALDASTGRMRELFPRVKTWMASLNADGRTMLFARHAADSAMTEYLVAAAGRPDGRVVATAPSVGANRIIARPKISPEGDRLFLVRNAGDAPDTLTVLRTDGTSARQVAIASRIFSAMWDPSGRFIGYTGMANGKPMLRVVEVATGVERDLALPSSSGRLWWITDWSRDGRFVGVEETRVYWEYWVVQGLLEGGR